MADAPAAPSGFRWRTAFKIAIRELRSSPGRFLFVVLAVAVGVGVLSGVRGFSEAFRGTLLREARTLMAADLLIRDFDPPTPAQTAVLDRLVSQGVALTRITETVSMLSSEKVPTPMLVSVKAVDPTVYPFYGQVKLDPPGELSARLRATTVVVSPDLPMRLRVGVGDSVRLGRESFRIAGIVRLEPDRMTGSLNVGPRIMITRAGLDRAGLMRAGSRASRRFLFRIPPKGPDIRAVRKQLADAFPGALISDYREVHPRIKSGLDYATTFLSLVSLIAMIVGALGVGMAMYSHLQQRLDTIAIMKCLGARSGQIIRIYLLQTLLMGLAGGLLGAALGAAVQAAFPLLIERYFQLRPETVWNLSAAAQGVLIGMLVTLLFTLPPLLGIRDVRPALIFRREMPEARRSLRDRWMRARASLLVGAATFAGLGAIAAWLAAGDGWREAVVTSGVFLAVLVGSLAALSAVAWLLLESLRRLLQVKSLRLPVTMRHGIANLYRPGNHAQAVLVALGVGVMFTLTVFLLQHGLIAKMMRRAPKDLPNVFLINITKPDVEGLRTLLGRQPGLAGAPEIFISARARILSIDGAPIDRMRLPDWARRYRRERSVTSLAEPAANLTIADGEWWTEGAGEGAQPEVCVATHIAKALGIRLGSQLVWDSGGVEFSARVRCLHRVEDIRFGPSLDFVFRPGSLDHLPTTWYGGVRVRPDGVAGLQRAVYKAYPAITVINAAEVLAIAQDVLDQVALVIRFVALFAILAGVIILASSVAGTRFRRMREAAILKTVGATRKRVMLIFSVEFLILGAMAGLIGGVLASGFSGLLLTRWFDAPFQFDLWPNLAAVILTAFIAVTTGWLASFRILGQRPLEVLRNE